MIGPQSRRPILPVLSLAAPPCFSQAPRAMVPSLLRRAQAFHLTVGRMTTTERLTIMSTHLGPNNGRRNFDSLPLQLNLKTKNQIAQSLIHLPQGRPDIVEPNRFNIKSLRRCLQCTPSQALREQMKALHLRLMRCLRTRTNAWRSLHFATSWRVSIIIPFNEHLRIALTT
jgi:hypothetical protein